MKIVVLDGHALNPGDISWQGLQQLGRVVIHERTAPHQLLERADGAEILLSNKTPITAAVMVQLPYLKYIGLLATGYNVIDVDAAKKHGIVVANAPGYGTTSVVQQTFALLLELTQRTQRHSDSVMAGDWARSVDFCYWNYPLVELAGKTMGIIGFGHIGQKVGDVATAFGMNIIGNSRTRTDQSARTNFRWADIPELLDQADVVSIHCPLFPETQGLINAENLKRMKSSAYLINTSRGAIVNDQDLADALNSDIIAGAGIDVLSAEPPQADNPLFNAKNCIITPHIAWATKEARVRLMNMVVSNVAAFIKGSPVNVVNK